MKRLTIVRNRVASNEILPGIADGGIMNPIPETRTIAMHGA